MKKKRKLQLGWPEIVIALVVLATTGFIGYMYWVGSQPSSKLTISASNEVFEEKNSVIPESWKIYKNTKYSFSIAHPEEDSVTARNIKQPPEIKFMFFINQKTPESHNRLNLIVRDGSIDQMIEKAKLDVSSDEVQSINIQKGTFKGHSSAKIVWLSKADSGMQSVSLYIEARGNLYELVASGAGDVNEFEHPIVKQIINSFTIL